MILFFIMLCILSICILYSKSVSLYSTVFWTSFVLSILAFFQDVNPDSDLMVSFEHLDNIRKYGWAYFDNTDIATSFYFRGRDGLKIYFYLISFLQCNNFFSAISVFLFYYMPMLGILECARYYKVAPEYTKWCLIILIWMVDFFDGSNGVRNMLSFGIFAYAVTTELLVNEKKIKIRSFVLYVIAALIHSSAWVLVFLRLMLYLKKESLIFVSGIILLFWSYGLDFLSLSDFINSENAIAASMEHHMSAYAGDNIGEGNYSADVFNNSASYMLMRTFRLFHVLAILFPILFIWIRNRSIDNIMKYIYLLSCFCLGAYLSSFATNIFTRYSFEIIFLTPVFFVAYTSRIILLNLGQYKLNRLAVVFLIIVLLFNYYLFRYHYHYMHFGFNIY